MKSKINLLRENHFLIKTQFGDLISITDLAMFCDIHRRTIERYLADNIIFSCKIEGRKRAIFVDSLLPNFKIPSKNNFHSLIKNRELYCKEKDFIHSLNMNEYQSFKGLEFKKIVFQNKTLICMTSLSKSLYKIEETAKRVIL